MNSMTTVFDVASELIERSGGSLEAVKLQKLCFYAYGWYARLTGEPLFDETFYAMPRGPVVSELLSAHAGQISVDGGMMETQRQARDEEREELDAYKTAVIDAVWSAYGSKSSWTLVKMTHAEQVWDSAWKSRRQGSKRGELLGVDILEHFLGRESRSDEEIKLPPPMLSRGSREQLAEIEATSTVHRPFIEAVRSFDVAS